MQKTKVRKICAVFLLVILYLQAFLYLLMIQPKAAVVSYSDVMDDLSKDKSFDIANYPTITYDQYKVLEEDSDPENDVEFLSVIQIAESENGELFIYTYQPMNAMSDITASSVLLYTGESKVDPVKKTLKCVSFDGVFKKYLVEDLEFPSSTYRYYNIVEIERPFDSLLDGKISDETITNFKAVPVGQTWCCYYSSSGLVYEMTTLDVVKITPTLTDFLYLENGITWGSLVGINSACSAHYIAFNIDNYEADKIVDAYLEYSSRAFKTYTYSETGVFPFLGSLFGRENEHTITQYPEGLEYDKETVTLHDYDVVSNNGSGLLAKQYSWNRIMPAQEFKEQFINQGVTFSDSTLTALDNSEWVFAYAETSVSHYASFVPAENPWGTSYETRIVDGVEVGYVDVFRLHFMVGEETYNLGVVGDTTSADDKPGGVGEGIELPDFNDFFKELMKICGILIAVIIVVVLWGPISIVLKLIWTAIETVFELLLSIITLPFRLIFGFFRR